MNHDFDGGFECVCMENGNCVDAHFADGGKALTTSSVVTVVVINQSNTYDVKRVLFCVIRN